MTGKKDNNLRSQNTETGTMELSITTDFAAEPLAGFDRYQWISEAAYFKAQARGFASENQILDWLEAEQEFQVILARKKKIGLVSLS